jgi:hypothetical protein
MYKVKAALRRTIAIEAKITDVTPEDAMSRHLQCTASHAANSMDNAHIALTFVLYSEHLNIVGIIQTRRTPVHHCPRQYPSRAKLSFQTSQKIHWNESLTSNVTLPLREVLAVSNVEHENV